MQEKCSLFGAITHFTEFWVYNHFMMKTKARYRFKLDPMSEDWHDRCSNQGWTQDSNLLDQTRINGEQIDPRLDALKSVLLEACGFVVCLPKFEEDIQNILLRGEFARGNRSKSIPGKPCDCHCNSCFLWEENKDTFHIWTGYALSRNGAWRQHSWCTSEIEDEIKLIETTEKRLLYFGYKMTDEEANEFCWNNIR